MINLLIMKLCKRLKDMLKSIGLAIGITDTNYESRTNTQSHSLHRRSNTKIIESNKKPNQLSTPQKGIFTPKIGVKDALIIGASLHELNRQASRAHKHEEKDGICDYEEYLDDDELFDDDIDFLDDDLDLIDDDIDLLDDDLYIHDEGDDLLNDDVYDSDYTDYNTFSYIDENNPLSENINGY